MNYKFQIQSITALLLHNNNILERDRLDGIRKKMKGGKAGDDRSPPESWKTYLYSSDETSNICMPAENLMAALLLAGMKCKVGGKETLKTHSQRIMLDRLDYDLLFDGKPLPKSAIDNIDGEFGEHAVAARELGFRLLVKPATVGATKHIRVRPMFGQWSCAGTFEIEDDDASILNKSALVDLFSTAGRLVGLGDWRPSSPKRPGPYGRFTATVEKV
jgi:hypothetical protein